MTTHTSASRRVLVLRCPQWLDTADDGQERDSEQKEDSAAAARAFEPVVGVVAEFCPQVEVLRPGVCAIPTRGPARYFGGEAELAAKLAEAVCRAGFTCQAGVADGLFAAGLAARTGPTGMLVPAGEAREFLAGFPVGVLGLPELCELLPRLGIETLGQLASLPLAEAASRFGADGKLASRLARGLACVRVQVAVRCSDGHEFSRLWRHDGLLSALAVAERVRWQLDGWQRDSNPSTAGITLLRLTPDQLVRATGRQLALWGDSVISDRVARAAMRVQALLGHDRAVRPSLAGGRRPADEVLLVPFGDAGEPLRPVDRPWPGRLPAPAPATVYPAPLAASVTDESGVTVSVSGRAELSAPPAWLATAGRPARAVASWAGPWPITEQWWDPRHVRRQARLQLITDDGNAWLAALQDGRWLIEASYD